MTYFYSQELVALSEKFIVAQVIDHSLSSPFMHCTWFNNTLLCNQAHLCGQCTVFSHGMIHYAIPGKSTDEPCLLGSTEAPLRGVRCGEHLETVFHILLVFCLNILMCDQLHNTSCWVVYLLCCNTCWLWWNSWSRGHKITLGSSTWEEAHWKGVLIGMRIHIKNSTRGRLPYGKEVGKNSSGNHWVKLSLD